MAQGRSRRRLGLETLAWAPGQGHDVWNQVVFHSNLLGRAIAVTASEADGAVVKKPLVQMHGVESLVRLLDGLALVALVPVNVAKLRDDEQLLGCASKGPGYDSTTA